VSEAGQIATTNVNGVQGCGDTAVIVVLAVASRS
jgi:hypothetical protein